MTVKVPRTWENVNNRMLRNAMPSSEVTGWCCWIGTIACENPSYLYGDGVHLRPEGAQAFADDARAVTAPRAPYSDRLTVPRR